MPLAAPFLLGLVLLAQVAPPASSSTTAGGAELSPTHVVGFLVGVGGSVIATLKACAAWVNGQLEKKDALIAQHVAEVARVNAEADRRVDACTQKCAEDAKASRAEVIALLRELAHSKESAP